MKKNKVFLLPNGYIHSKMYTQEEKETNNNKSLYENIILNTSY